jgi:hypothetical protein
LEIPVSKPCANLTFAGINSFGISSGAMAPKIANKNPTKMAVFNNDKFDCFY